MCRIPRLCRSRSPHRRHEAHGSGEILGGGAVATDARTPCPHPRIRPSALQTVLSRPAAQWPLPADSRRVVRCGLPQGGSRPCNLRTVATILRQLLPVAAALLSASGNG